jgi:hypothetical protein
MPAAAIPNPKSRKSYTPHTGVYPVATLTVATVSNPAERANRKMAVQNPNRSRRRSTYRMVPGKSGKTRSPALPTTM